MVERGEFVSARQIAAKAGADGLPPAFLSLGRLQSVIPNKRNLQEMQDVRGAQKSTHFTGLQESI